MSLSQWIRRRLFARTAPIVNRKSSYQPRVERLEDRSVMTVNQAPVAGYHVAALMEDSVYQFAEGDFQFSDPNDSPTNNFLNLKVLSTPNSGTLRNGTTVLSSGDFVSVADINAGLLTYTPNADHAGSDGFYLAVQDDGGTAGGGQDTSSGVVMSLVILPINDAPDFTAADVTVDEDAVAVSLANWAAFNPGGGIDEAAQTATYLVTNISNPSLFSQPPAIDSAGNLTFTLAADANGVATFDVQVQDDGGGSDLSSVKTYTITVNPVNDAPDFTGSDSIFNEDAGAVTIPNWATFNPGGGSDEATQTATYIVTSISDPSLFTQLPAVDSAGNLTFTLAADANGVASFDVQVSDDGGTNLSSVKTFTIRVNPVNDAPVIDTSNPTLLQSLIGEVVSLQISATDAENDAMTYSATSLPPGLSMDANGLITGTISASADITTPYSTVVTVSDGVASNTLTITWKVRSPSITIIQPTDTTSATDPMRPTYFGYPAVFTAEVRAFDPTVATIPTGTVTFRDGTNVLGTATLNAIGIATFTTSTLSIGTHEITATYNGDTAFDASTAETLGSCTQIVYGGVATGRVWDDANANGLQDSGEDGVENVVVDLLDTSGTVVTCATTDDAGVYWFRFLDPGLTYAIRIDRPSGHRFTFFNSGTDPWLDSDTGSSDGKTNNFTVASGYYKAFDSGLIDLADRPINTLLGAGAVPGNSTYTYTIVLDGLPAYTWGEEIVGSYDPVTSAFLQQSYDSITNTYLVSRTITFGNAAPGDVIEKVSVGGVVLSSREVYVVQVSVAYGDYLSYSGTPGPVDVPVDASITSPTGIAMKGVLSGSPGAAWGAQVTLIGPGANLGVDQIHVGFVQHITMQSWSGQYAQYPPSPSTLPSPHTHLVNSLQGQTLLDMADDAFGIPGVDSTYTDPPWYDRREDATFFGATATNNTKYIHSMDTPGMSVPMEFNQVGWFQLNAWGLNYNNQRRLTQISIVAQFTLDVAASTIDTSNGADNSYWAQYRANWTFNGTGTVGEYVGLPVNNILWTGVGSQTNGDSSWSAVTAPTAENIGGPLFNQAMGASTFSPAP